MNIIYMHTHDTGRFIQPYGHKIPTPRLQQFAEEGVLFRHCYNGGPTCSPSRAALLTGMAPHSCGMTGLAHRGFSLNDYSRHLARFLGRNGFETVLCGVQHVVSYANREKLGYEQILKSSEFDWDGFKADLAERGIPSERENAHCAMRQDILHAEAAADFLREPKDKPFFLSFGMISTHRVFPVADEDINPDYLQPPPPLPDNAEMRQDMAEFATMARCVDNCVKIVLDAVEEADLVDDTLVFFTTDHGIAFPWMKCNLYDPGIGVSLIMRFPKGKYGGKAIDSLVSHIDIYPTLCEILGLEKPDWLQGVSIMPLLDGGKDQVRDVIFSEVSYHASYEPMRCVRTECYKYIKYFDDFDKVVKPNIDDGISKQFYLKHGLETRAHDPAEMLFDLYFDPQERNNLIVAPEYSDILCELRRRLQKWMEETDDPLLAGSVPFPEGGVDTPKDSLHV